MCGYVKTKNDKYIDDEISGTVSGSNNIFAIAASAECDNYNILDCVVAYCLHLNNSFNNVNTGSKYKYSIDKSIDILTFIILHEDQGMRGIMFGKCSNYCTSCGIKGY